ncbi:MAG: hypothetical protein K2K70_12545, partial [Lachnospiraceae bacterium]|nr:hypothetical protein [Lachnospiraceae bacterium]
DGSENYGQQIAHRDDAENYEQQVAYRDGSENHRRGDFGGNERYGQPNYNEERRYSREHEEREEREERESPMEYRENERERSQYPRQNGIPGMRQFFPRWMGMPLFGRRPVGNGNIPIPQMAEWSNGSRHMAESGEEKHTDDMGDVTEQSINRSSYENKEKIEEQAVCRNCPFKRKGIDYGKRILMTFPVMRPFPNDQQLACVRIEPQDLGCLPMQMWTLANNHFLLQGYYCYRHLIFMETGKQGYALGVPGVYDRRTSRQAEQFGFVQFRAICNGKQCEGAFGYWIMPLSC